ncbi:hypothetical protein BHE74_00026854 [Ensete ventricosum]|nr:hypothetical protein GW17_00048061 [Ensete ventricosum]RWW65815.1 hypothetical protein BHE74_00026854 [Ensete ventricosum]RZS07228.1 hypothetical protein BHM03_00038025 [Ensete ventricosum]
MLPLSERSEERGRSAIARPSATVAASKGNCPRAGRKGRRLSAAKLLVTCALQANHMRDGTCDTLHNLFAYD